MHKALAALVAGWAGMAAADVPPMEWAEVGEAVVLVYPLMFVGKADADILRGFLNDGSTLAELVPLDGHGAVAMSPDDGLWRDGAWVASVTGAGGMASAETAAAAALAGCNARRTGEVPCVVVVEIQPK